MIRQAHTYIQMAQHLAKLQFPVVDGLINTSPSEKEEGLLDSKYCTDHSL